MSWRETVAQRVREQMPSRNGDDEPIGCAADEYPPDERGDAYEGQPSANGNGKRHAPTVLASGPVAAQGLKPIPIEELLASFPDMRKPIIDGLLREGETMNAISHTKVGKSWLVLSLIHGVACGTQWLGFPTTQGRVLLIDNELHKETLSGRVKRVIEGLGGMPNGIVDVLPLRGRLQDLNSIGSLLMTYKPGQYKLVIIDAWYRTLPIGVEENENAAITGLYNQLDGYADYLQCAFVLVHHATKGSQAGKTVTDVGSGAGSQSRAADTHLILRQHEEEDHVVLEAAVRSFPPIKPKVLRWKWPFFTVTEEFDASNLLQPGGRRRAVEKSDSAPKETPWDAQRFAQTFGTAAPKSRAMILEDARAGGLSERLSGQLLQVAIDRGLLHEHKAAGRGHKMLVSTEPLFSE